jgi:hypothetical protein
LRYTVLLLRVIPTGQGQLDIQIDENVLDVLVANSRLYHLIITSKTRVSCRTMVSLMMESFRVFYEGMVFVSCVNTYTEDLNLCGMLIIVLFVSCQVAPNVIRHLLWLPPSDCWTNNVGR